MAFFPTSLSGLAAWYDASDSATVTGADPVTQWADKSGNARHLSHATLGPQHDAVQNVMQLRGGAWSGTSADTLDMPARTVRSVFGRSEERRVGKEWGSPVRSRWARYP